MRGYQIAASQMLHRFANAKRGERVVIGNLLFKVLRADSRRVHMLQLTLLPKPIEPEDA